MVGNQVRRILVHVAADSAQPVEPGEIEWSSGAAPVEMTVRSESVGVISIRDEDLFGALVQLRLQFEKTGRFLLCSAARKDAYPSRMLREMGGGRKVYLLRPGEQARKEDLVDVFEPAAFEQVCTVANQRLGYEGWLR